MPDREQFRCRLGYLESGNFASNSAHPRFRRLALHLGGSNCNAAAKVSLCESDEMWQKVRLVR